MKKNKIIKIVLINILSIVLIIITVDYFLHLNNLFSQVEGIDGQNTLETSYIFEQPLPYNNKKPPIVIMGCSFAYGSGLFPKEVLSYKLQLLTKRKAYNYAYPGHSVQHVLYKIQHSHFFNDINVQPEYVIYVFIEDHTRRMYKTFFNSNYDTNKYLKYKYNKHNKDHPLFAPYPPSQEITFTDYLKVTNIGKLLEDIFIWLKSDNEKFDFLKLHILECNKYLKMKHPNTKFVVVVYNSKSFMKTEKPGILKQFHTDRWNELEQEGIKVINFDTPEFDFLTRDEYNTLLRKNFAKHPSGLAWDTLVPIIIKELNL